MSFKGAGAICLKGSIDIVCEFFEYGINSILYQRGLYPADSFIQQEKYGLPLLITSNADLKRYLDIVINQLRAFLETKNVHKIVVVIIKLETMDTVERWQFDVDLEKPNPYYNPYYNVAQTSDNFQQSFISQQDHVQLQDRIPPQHQLQGHQNQILSQHQIHHRQQQQQQLIYQHQSTQHVQQPSPSQQSIHQQLPVYQQQQELPIQQMHHHQQHQPMQQIHHQPQQHLLHQQPPMQQQQQQQQNLPQHQQQIPQQQSMYQQSISQHQQMPPQQQIPHDQEQHPETFILKEIQESIRGVVRQITASVTFLPMLEGAHSFDILLYTDKDVELPNSEWSDTNARLISNGEHVQLRGFTTHVHRVAPVVSYRPN